MTAARIRHTLVLGPTSQAHAAVVSYLALVIAAVPTVIALAQAIGDRKWVDAAGWGLFILLLAVIGYVLAPDRAREQASDTRYFQPFVDIKELKAWPRPAEGDELIAAVTAVPERLVVVVGPSGAGKSVLLRNLLPTALPNCSYAVVDTYGDLQSRLESVLAEAQKARNETILVLDQFEQFLGLQAQGTERKRGERETWLLAFLRTVIAEPKLRAVISVRKEWFYDLRWLQELAPSPNDCIDVSPPLSDEASETRRAITDRFESVVGDDAAAEEIVEHLGRSGRLRPLEVQMVGAVLERAVDAGETSRPDLRYLQEHLGGVDGAIRSYFDDILERAPDRRVAVKVLCALSARTRFRRQERRGDILDVLFEDDASGQAAITYLLDRHLLVSTSSTEFELAHDYLAEVFHQQSGSELDPAERDNILFHIDSRGGTENQVVKPRTARQDASFLSLGTVTIGLLVGVMTVRLLYFGIPWVRTSDGPIALPLIHGRVFDKTYIPIFLAHLGWALYVGLFYHRVCRHLVAPMGTKLLTRFMVLNMAACVLVAMFAPAVWILSIAWGGFVVGATLLAVAQLNPSGSLGRARARTTARITLVNCAFLALAGVLAIIISNRYVHGTVQRKTKETDNWIDLNIVISIALTYACYAMMSIHTQRPAVARLLGLLARSSRDMIPRPEV